MKEVILFVIAIIKKGDKYLLTKRQEIDKKDPKDFLGKWQLPGGGVNFGERVEEAVKREVKEELALDVEVISTKFLHWIDENAKEEEAGED